MSLIASAVGTASAADYGDNSRVAHEERVGDEVSPDLIFPVGLKRRAIISAIRPRGGASAQAGAATTRPAPPLAGAIYASIISARRCAMGCDAMICRPDGFFHHQLGASCKILRQVAAATSSSPSALAASLPPAAQIEFVEAYRASQQRIVICRHEPPGAAWPPRRRRATVSGKMPADDHLRQPPSRLIRRFR